MCITACTAAMTRPMSISAWPSRTSRRCRRQRAGMDGGAGGLSGIRDRSSLGCVLISPRAPGARKPGRAVDPRVCSARAADQVVGGRLALVQQDTIAMRWVTAELGLPQPADLGAQLLDLLA